MLSRIRITPSASRARSQRSLLERVDARHAERLTLLLQRAESLESYAEFGRARLLWVYPP